MVNELLKIGKSNIMTSEELINSLKLSGTRELVSIVQKERQQGAVILSTCGNGGGYYLPETEQELKEFIKSMDRRKSELDKSTASARKELKRLREIA